MGQTGLHIAAEMGKVDIVEMILKAGVDLEIQDRVTNCQKNHFVYIRFVMHNFLKKLYTFYCLS